MAGVALDLDGTTLRSARIAALVPGRVLLHRTDGGLMPDNGPLDDAMVAALRLLAETAVRVDVDVAVRRSGREWRVHSWQGLRDGTVATISTLDGHTYELAWLVGDMWRLELARAATVDPGVGPRVVPDLVELPHELLLATGGAWHRRRADLIAELSRRLGGRVYVDGKSCPGDPAVLLTTLHSDAIGRLQALVRHRGPVGQVTWLRYADGWRQLTPHVREGERLVRFEMVDELRLGVEVARLLGVPA